MGKRKAPEHSLQSAVVDFWAIYGRPELVFFAVANGGARHLLVAKKLKAEGVLPGMPDIGVSLDNGRTGWMELKAPRGHLSDAQKGIARKLQRLDHYWALVKSLEDAAQVLEAWGALRKVPNFSEAP